MNGTNGINGKSYKPRRRNNLASVFYTEELGARVVAQSGIPTDRHHVGKLIFQSLKEDPDRIAQIDGALDKKETTGSVLKRSIQCAIAMTHLGLKKGDVVVAMAPNHVDLCIPVFASMYLGVYLAGTDMTLGVRELEKSFEVNKPKIVFCQSDRAADVDKALKGSNTKGHVVTFDKDSTFQSFTEFLQTHTESNVKVEDFKPTDFDPEETVIFLTATSGTTGLPKSAILTHKNVAVGFPQLMARYPEFPTPTRLYLLISPLQWLSANMIFVTSSLYKFTRLQSSRPATRDHIYDLINKYRPTSFLSSPTFMVNLLAPEERGRCDFTCFNDIILGGSFVPHTIFEIFKEIAPNVQLELGYGMSEITGFGFAWEPEYPKGTVGKPSPHLNHRLVDPVTLQDVTEPNVAGEVWFKGPPVFKGYFNNPEATKEAFVDGWLRSGDLLSRDENNHYFFVDRLKMLLKYRNHQISPLEVEAEILKHPGVHDAVVVGLPDLECGDLPTAFVVTHPGHKVTAQEIKDIVKENLTDSKQLRGGVIFIKELPQTVTTKVDRVKLKKMATQMERE
ncbi:hypothetical protein ABMA27_008539 [Loxostege sticticalis]|uniref:Luciferin 4-monooxygenase n=1 Tax=Loxostege sticticalis TaxID=481309 RepID=A0ABR3HBP3_LOXSC